MTKIEKQLDLNAPPESVFAAVSVPEKWARWHVNVKRASSNGSKTHWVYGWKGFKVESVTEVTEIKSNSVYAFRQTDGFFNGAETRFEIQPSEKGSRVKWTIEYRLPDSYLGKLMNKLSSAKSLGDGMEHSFTNLKQFVERR